MILSAQPAKLYGLAKLHKQDTPFSPVLSLPGSLYDHSIKVFAKNFAKIVVANIKTNTKMAREIWGKTQLDSDESITSLDVRSLYTNIPLKEDVEIAMRRVYEQTKTQELSRKSMKKLINLAASKVHFKCNVLWCVQKDGSSLASLGV